MAGPVSRRAAPASWHDHLHTAALTRSSTFSATLCTRSMRPWESAPVSLLLRAVGFPGSHGPGKDDNGNVLRKGCRSVRRVRCGAWRCARVGPYPSRSGPVRVIVDLGLLAGHSLAEVAVSFGKRGALHSADRFISGKAPTFGACERDVCKADGCRRPGRRMGPTKLLGDIDMSGDIDQICRGRRQRREDAAECRCPVFAITGGGR